MECKAAIKERKFREFPLLSHIFPLLFQPRERNFPIIPLPFESIAILGVRAGGHKDHRITKSTNASK